MVSAKSEGSTTLKQKFRVEEYKQVGNAPQPDESHGRRDESSDDSGGEEEHIVRIDSPSRLSFRQAP